MGLFGHSQKKSNTAYIADGISVRNGRPTNMDRLLIMQRFVDHHNVLLAAVCDGVGSLENGAYASNAIKNGLLSWFQTLETVNKIQLAMRDEVLTINSEILTVSAQNAFETASTLSALLIVDNKYYIVHIGDSRVYILDQAGLKKLTQDDKASSGALTGCIGHDADPIIFCGEGRFRDETFLICSDGLYNRMDIPWLQEQIRSISEKTIRKILESATQRVITKGEKDNISLAIVKIRNGGK